jgi:hypothetical protein
MNDNELKMIAGFVERAVAAGVARSVDECGVAYSIMTILGREVQANAVMRKQAVTPSEAPRGMSDPSFKERLQQAMVKTPEAKAEAKG